MSAGPAEGHVYLFRHLGEEPWVLRSPGFRERFVAKIDDGFLGEQAAFHEDLGGLRRLLDAALLPATLAAGEWSRFLRFALVTINLRGLAASLPPEVLAAVAAVGRVRLAATLAGERVAPLDRVLVRAAVAEPWRRRFPDRADAAILGDLRDRLREDLDSLATVAERRQALEELARRLPDTFRARWEEWIAALQAAAPDDPAIADGVRLALAEAALLDGDEEAEADRQLVRVGDPAAVAALLVRRAGELGGDLAAALDRLCRIAAGRAEVYSPPAVALVARRAVASPAAAADELAQARRRGPFAWSLAAIEAGGATWAALPAPRREELVGELAATPERAAALAVVGLEAGGDDGLAAAAEPLVAALADAPARLHWEARRLLARPLPGTPVFREAVTRLFGRAAAAGFAMPSPDLARLLDLVAEAWPDRLARHLDDVLWAPASDASTLRSIARSTRHPRLHDELVRRAERLAVTVAESEAAAFELRRELLHDLTIAACRRSESIDPLAAARRLLPDEADELRAAVATALAAEGHGRLARAAAERIAAPALRRRTDLAILAASPGDAAILDAAELYRAVASTEAVEDELATLAALDDDDPDPRSVARRHLEGIADRPRRVLALAELARARLDEELGRPASVRDPELPLLPLVDDLGVVASDEWLCALAPALAELGAAAGPRRAALELGEAADRVVLLTGAPWTDRQRALVCLLRSAPSLLAGAGGPAGGRLLAELLRRLLALPRRLAGRDGADELRRRGHRLLPYLVAAVESAPAAVRRHLERPLGARLAEAFSLPADGRRRAVGGEAAAPAPWLRALLAGWETDAEAAAVCALCAASEAARRERERRVLAGDGSASEAEALAVLAAARRPGVSLALAAARPAEERRELLLSLLAAGLLAGAAAGVAASLLGRSPEILAVRLRAGDDLTADVLVAAVEGGALDAADPALLPLRRRLRQAADPALADRLAAAVLPALARHGPRAGESALRLWLHAAWVTRLRGADAPAEWLRTVRRAAVLGPAGTRAERQGQADGASESPPAEPPATTAVGDASPPAPTEDAASTGERVLTRWERCWGW